MAVSILVAYGLPLIRRKVSSSVMIVVNPIFVIIMILLGVGAMFYLWKYKHYKEIMRTALHTQRG